MAISKRKDRQGKPIGWQVTLNWRDPVTGKRQRRTVGTYRTRKEAERRERDALTELDRGTFVDPATTTVKDMLDAWLTSKADTVSGNAVKDYEIAIRLHIIPALGNVKVQQLTPSHVQRTYATWRSEGMSARYVRRCHLVLHQALAQAVRLGMVSRNVSTGIELPRMERGQMQVWTPGQVSAFLEEAKRDTWAPLWYLLALEGLRRGEALGLRWRDLNTDRGTAHIVQSVIVDRTTGAAVIQERTKTRAGARSVRLTRQTIAALEAHKDRQRFLRNQMGGRWHDHDLVICTRTGGPVNPANVTRAYDRLVMLSGVPRIRVHDLRHTAASNLLRAGVPLKVVSERLGHASISITADTYAHISEHMQESAAEAMSDLIDRAGGL